MTTQQSNVSSKALVPQVSAAQTQQSSLRKLFSGHNIMMMACCAAMAVGTGVLVATAPAGQSLGQTLLLAAPLVGCLVCISLCIALWASHAIPLQNKRLKPTDQGWFHHA